MLPRYPVTLGTGGTPVGGGGSDLPPAGWGVPYPIVVMAGLTLPTWVFGADRWVQSGLTAEEWFR